MKHFFLLLLLFLPKIALGQVAYLKDFSLMERRNAASYVAQARVNDGDTVVFGAFVKEFYADDPYHRWLMYRFNLCQGNSPIAGRVRIAIASKKDAKKRRALFTDEATIRNADMEAYMLQRQLFKVRFQEVQVWYGAEKPFRFFVHFEENVANLGGSDDD